MYPDLSKPEASSIFEAFGFGAIILISSFLGYREHLGLPDLTVLGGTVGDVDLNVILISIVIFISYIVGLAAIELGNFVSGDERKYIGDIEGIQAKCISPNNPRVWELFNAMLRKVRFANGSLGVFLWLTLIIFGELVKFVVQTKSMSPFLLLLLFVGLCFSLVSKLQSNRARLSFSKVLKLFDDEKK